MCIITQRDNNNIQKRLFRQMIQPLNTPNTLNTITTVVISYLRKLYAGKLKGFSIELTNSRTI